MGTSHQRMFRLCSCNYFKVIRSLDIKEWHPLILIYIPTRSSDCSPHKTCNMTFLLCHVINVMRGHVADSLGTISMFPPNLVQISFFILWNDDIENWHYKVRQLLQHETENSYCKVITKCDSSLLQIVSGIILRRVLHKKWSFPLRISSENVTKSTGSIYWRNP